MMGPPSRKDGPITTTTVVGSSSNTTTATTPAARRTSTESQQVGEEFAEFLKGLDRSEVALDVSKQVVVVKYWS